MKKLLLGVVLLAVAQTGIAADGKLHIKGKMTGLGDSVVVGVIDYVAQNYVYRDTVPVKGCEFDFYVPLKKVAPVQCIGLSALRENRQAGFTVVGVPGEEVVVSGEATDRYDINGSRFYQQYHEADVLVEPVLKEINELMTECRARMKKGVSRDSVAAYYDSKAPGLQTKLEQTIFGFAKAHPTYEASAALVSHLEGEQMQKLVELLAPEVRDGRMKDYYSVFIDSYVAQKESKERAQKVQAAGTEAPDFTLNDIAGKPLKLSSLRGKYVVLDFWGSWCGWCIKGFPKMKEYYAKYKGKFQILGIDCNDSQERWKDAVKKHQLPWLHVYNGKAEADAVKLYAIQGYPTKIIVDPQGKVAKTFVGEDPAFYTYLDGLFKK